MGDLRRAKAELRGRMRAIRDAIPPEERARRSLEIERRVLDLSGASAAGTVLAFATMGSEVSTAGLLERWADRGLRVCLPVLVEPEMLAVTYRPGDPVQRAAYGADEPAGRDAVEPSEVDLAVTPGLAFDRDGYRVGYGGGYFDRFLAALRPDALAAGVAFHEQLVAAVPHGDGDVPVRFVVTDLETVACR